MFVPRQLKKELFSQESCHSQNFIYENLKSPLLKRKIQVCPTDLISCESHEWLKVPFTIFSHHGMIEYEWIYDRIFMLLNDFILFSHSPLFSFQLMHFRNSFCYRTENNWNFKCQNFESCRPLGDKPHFSSPLGIAEISRLSKFSIYSEIILLKTFTKHF